MGTKEEINEMFDALEKVAVGSDAPSTDAPVQETPAEEPKEDAAPATDQPKEEKEQDQAPATTPPKDDEVERIKAENEELRKKMDEQAKKAEADKPPATDPPIPDQDFVKDVDLDEVTRDPSSFNKLLNNIYKKAVDFARGESKKVKEEAITVVPDVIEKRMEAAKTLKEISDNFYKQNEDLKPFGKVVGVVFEELAQQNPGKSYAEILGKVGEETRKRLDLKKPEPKPDPEPKAKDKDDPPALPRKKGGRVTKPAQSDSNPLASEIDAMNKVLGR